MTHDNSTGHDADARAAAIELLKAGDGSPSDAAHLAGVDRRVVAYWIKVANIDPAKAYDARIARAWRKHLGKIKGTAKPKRLSKAEMRADGEKAVANFNEKRRKKR